MAEEKMTLTGNQLMQLFSQEKERLGQINSRIITFQNMKNELMSTKKSLEEISKSKKGSKIMLPLGAGIYIEALTEDNEKAISTISNNVFRAKKIEDILKLIEKRSANIDRALEQNGEDQAKVISRANQLENIMAAGRQALKNQNKQ